MNTTPDFVLASLCVSVCRRSMLCSLAEEEIKTESDVVEGMDAALRSKGKSPRPYYPGVKGQLSDTTPFQRVWWLFSVSQELLQHSALRQQG